MLCSYMYICISNRVSLHEFAMSILKGHRYCAKESDALSIIGGGDGKLVLCYACQRLFTKVSDWFLYWLMRIYSILPLSNTFCAILKTKIYSGLAFTVKNCTWWSTKEDNPPQLDPSCLDHVPNNYNSFIEPFFI